MRNTNDGDVGRFLLCRSMIVFRVLQLFLSGLKLVEHFIESIEENELCHKNTLDDRRPTDGCSG